MVGWLAGTVDKEWPYWNRPLTLLAGSTLDTGSLNAHKMYVTDADIVQWDQNIC